MMYDAELETRSVEEQFALDRESYRRQIRYLFDHSAFYRRKLVEAGFSSPAHVGELDDIAGLPFTEKDEIRATQAVAPPFGDHLACPPDQLQRIYNTSGTSGVPCLIGLTRNDLAGYATNVARGYTAAGFAKGQRIVVGFNAGPFVAGAVYDGFDKLACTVIPIGTGNTERLVGAIQRLNATGISCTPSYGLYLIDWCRDRDINTLKLGLRNMITAGEPGGGDPLIRGRLEGAFGCKVRESMGIGDITLSAWAEDDDGNGMHFMARGFAHIGNRFPTRLGRRRRRRTGIHRTTTGGDAVIAFPEPRPRHRKHETQPTGPDRPQDTLRGPHRRYAHRARRQPVSDCAA